MTLGTISEDVVADLLKQRTSGEFTIIIFGADGRCSIEVFPYHKIRVEIGVCRPRIWVVDVPRVQNIAV